MAGTLSSAPSYALPQPGPGGIPVPKHERVVLENGITLIVIPRPEVPLIAFQAVLRGGALADPHDRPGVASIIAGLLDKGAGARDAFAFADEVEGVGGSFVASAGSESITIGGQFLARDHELMLSLLADALLRPRLDEAEFDKLRDRQIELIKATKDTDPSELLGAYGRAFLFGRHPYSNSVLGSEGSLAAIQHHDVLEYYRTQFGADRLSLIFAGDVDTSWLMKAINAAFAKWNKAASPLPVPPQPVRTHQRRVLLVDSPGAVQSYFWIGSVGVDKHYPERAALDLVNTLYGGRFTSILNTELRIKSGLSYGAGSGFTRGNAAGEFSLRSFTQTENTVKALDLSLETLSRLKKKGVTREDLNSARAYVLGQYPLTLETAAHWAAAMGELELYGLGPDYIESYGPSLEKVGLKEAKLVIDKVFPDPREVSIVLIGDAEKIRDQLKKYGPITEMSLTQPSFDPQAD
jgi:predicted Zn-dependent peptidase